MLNAKKRKAVLDEEDKITEDLKEILRVKKLKNLYNQNHQDQEKDEDKIE